MLQRFRARRSVALIAGGLAGAMVLAACGGGATAGDAAAGAGAGERPIVGIITKTDTNPFFVKLREGAQLAADAAGVELQAFAGRSDGDNESQVQAIENLISAGAAGFLIAAADSAAIVSAVDQARQAGLVVIALDTPLDPPSAADATFATDNFEAGELIGQWARARFEQEGREARIAFIDASPRQISVDVQRDQGFMSGFGIELNDPNLIGDESDPRIVGHAISEGEQDKGRTAMEQLLQQAPDLNLVYTINEPAAAGAYEALRAAGREQDVTIVSVDGGCPGVEAIGSGQLGATSQQYPLLMAQRGVEAIAAFAGGGARPANPSGSDFINTGVNLITDQPVSGVESEDTAFGTENCWG